MSEDTPQTEPAAPEQKPPAKPSPARRRRPYPGPLVWVIAVLFGAGIAFVRLASGGLDPAIVNILTLVQGFVIFMALLTWFTFFSPLPLVLRIAPIVLLLAAAMMLRVSHVSGDMVPVFRFAWSPPADESLQSPVANAAGEVNLSATGPGDFNQFLGSDRNAHVANVRLKRDWDSNPPREVWRRPIGAGWSAFAAVNGFAVTMEQRGNEELITCYDVASGQLQWADSLAARHETVLGGVGPRATPTIHQGKVYAQGGTGVVRCLDGATGERLWQFDVLAHSGVQPDEDGLAVAWGRAGSPLVVDNLVVVPRGGPQGGPYKSLVALDTQTGDVVWEGGDRQVSYASPSVWEVDGMRQIVCVNEDYVSGHDVETGLQQWQFPWPGNSTANASASQAVLLEGGRVLLSKGYGGGAALLQVALLYATPSDSSAAQTPIHAEAWSVDQLWANPTVLRTKFTNVVVYDGAIYGLSDGILQCVDLASGASQWKGRRYGHGQVLGVGDVLLVLSEQGELVMVDATPARFTKLGSIQALSGKTWNNLCLYGNYLLVRNAEEAACYELAVVESAE